MKKVIIRKLAQGTRTMIVFAIAGLMLVATQGCKKDDARIPTQNTDAYKSLNAAMRNLWTDHMQWTYNTVDAFFNNPEAVQANLTRLLQNQKDIGAAIVPYYGQAAGDTLASLLTTHISLAPPVLQAAKDNNQAALDAAMANWYSNAQDIADFLSTANQQNWPQEHMREDMKDHITQTTAYAVDLLKKDYTKAVADYQVAFDHMMHMADMLSSGIAGQYPDKF